MTEISIARQCIITVNQGVGTTSIWLDVLTVLINPYFIFSRNYAKMRYPLVRSVRHNCLPLVSENVHKNESGMDSRIFRIS